MVTEIQKCDLKCKVKGDTFYGEAEMEISRKKVLESGLKIGNIIQIIYSGANNKGYAELKEVLK
jgi:hypothetical protein